MRRAFGRVVGSALVLGLIGGFGAGCSDSPSSQAEGDQAVQGKTPVVRPEDVSGKGEGSAVLAPDYRRAMEPELARKEFAAAARSGRSAKIAAVSAEAQPASAAPASSPATAAKPSVSPPPVTIDAGVAASDRFPVSACRQLVVVVAPDATAHTGVVRRLTRTGPDAAWHEDGAPWQCVLGKGGLGVGRGLLPAMEGPRKRQGDRRTPAGLFSLPEAFGYASPDEAAKSGVRLPYKMVTDRTACLTEVGSANFGRILGASERTPGDSGRQERMKRTDDANRWGVVIAHNLENPDPEAGSCLFINVRPAGGPPTGGSIGLPEAQAAALTAWLDPEATPLVAVLPEKTYQQFKKPWGLP